MTAAVVAVPCRAAVYRTAVPRLSVSIGVPTLPVVTAAPGMPLSGLPLLPGPIVAPKAAAGPAAAGPAWAEVLAEANDVQARSAVLGEVFDNAPGVAGYDPGPAAVAGDAPNQAPGPVGAGGLEDEEGRPLFSGFWRGGDSK